MFPNARVMSPNDGSHEGILDEVRLYCQYCDTPVTELFVCTGCCVFGDAENIRLERFFGYIFCPTCLPKAAAEYAAFQDVQRREAWRCSLESQILNWRSRVTEAIGVSSTIGVAMGGAVVAAAGVAAGLAHGVVRGAATGSNMPHLALPSTNGEQASDAFLSLDGSLEAPNVRAGRLLNGSGEERARAPATERRLPRCQACWNPQVGRLRPSTLVQRRLYV